MVAKKVTKKVSKKSAKKTVAKASSNALAAKLIFLRAECGLVSVEAADRSSGGGGLPVGRSQAVKMDEAIIKFNKNQDPMITWHLIGIGEDNVNKHEFVNINLTADGRSFPYAKADVEAMGLDWNDSIDGVLKMLEAHPDAAAVHIEAAEGIELLVDVWTKAEFKNVAIVGLAEGEYGMAASEDSPEPADEPEDEPDGITVEDIGDMSDDELDALALAETSIDPARVVTYAELREQLIAELT